MPAEVPRVSIHGDAVRNAPHGDDNVDDAVVIDDIDESGSGCCHCPGEEEYLGCARTRRQKSRDIHLPQTGPLSLSLPKMYSLGRRIVRVPIETTTYMKHVRSVLDGHPSAPHPPLFGFSG